MAGEGFDFQKIVDGNSFLQNSEVNSKYGLLRTNKFTCLLMVPTPGDHRTDRTGTNFIDFCEQEDFLEFNVMAVNCPGVTLSVQTMEINGWERHSIATRKDTDLSITFIDSSGYGLRYFFYNWIQHAYNQMNMARNYVENYEAPSFKIVPLISSTNKGVMADIFYNVYPLTIESLAFDNENPGILKTTVTFKYQFHNIEPLEGGAEHTKKGGSTPWTSGGSGGSASPGTGKAEQKNSAASSSSPSSTQSVTQPGSNISSNLDKNTDSPPVTNEQTLPEKNYSGTNPPPASGTGAVAVGENIETGESEDKPIVGSNPSTTTVNTKDPNANVGPVTPGSTPPTDDPKSENPSKEPTALATSNPDREPATPPATPTVQKPTQTVNDLKAKITASEARDRGSYNSQIDAINAKISANLNNPDMKLNIKLWTQDKEILTKKFSDYIEKEQLNNDAIIANLEKQWSDYNSASKPT